MEKIKHYIAIINSALEEIDYPTSPQHLYQPIDYTIKLGGKRIRPALLLLSNDLFGGKVQQAVQPALGIEVFHNFTLVHDDIMDEAPLRRGKPTVYKKWSRDIAILSGDVMFVKAIQLLSKCNNNHLSEVLEIFTNCAIEVCEGQQFDMNFEMTENVSIDDYLRMIELKTAVLLAASLKIGAVLADTTPSNANHIYEFGKNLGIAFQLMDDILDLYGDPKKFGKRIGGDILTNKKTYLLLKAKELATGKLKHELEFNLSSKVLDDETKVSKVRGIFDQLGIRQLAIDEMNLFYNTAISHLDSINAPEDKKKVFEDFAKQLMNRES